MIAALPWPDWRQGLVAAVAAALAHAAVARTAPDRRARSLLPALHELAVVYGLYALWRSAKQLPLVQADGAIDRARRIAALQDAWGLPSELTFQRFLLRHDDLAWLASAYYATLHVPALIAFLVWLFARHRDRYGRWRDALAIATGGCLLIRFWRVAPPRFLPDLGYVDVAALRGFDVYGPVGTGVSQQFVAMPSIHVAWAAIVGLGALASTRSPWRWVVFAHLPITFVVVAATGHHWWLDGIVALGLVGLGLAVDVGVRRASEALGDRREEVVVLREGAEGRELGDHVVG